jgi:hypothetical protein
MIEGMTVEQYVKRVRASAPRGDQLERTYIEDLWSIGFTVEEAVEDVRLTRTQLIHEEVHLAERSAGWDPNP